MRLLKIQLHTPFGQTRRGNGVTAERWAAIFEQLGHRLVENNGDVLVALHARHSHAAIVNYKDRHPSRPIVLALTGTDIYRDVQHDADAQRSLELADRFVVLQPHALGELVPADRERGHVIYQSAVRPVDPPPRPTDVFQVCVVGHLRDVKDPFRTAEALRLLPENSRVHVLHLGGALDPEMRQRAQQETQTNPRYQWLGERSENETLRVIAGSHLMVLTSVMEGGANVLTEAIACGTPAVLSHMGAALGVLGGDYPGLFPIGDTAALAERLVDASTNETFYAELRSRCTAKLPLTDPKLERDSWRSLLGGLAHVVA